MRRWVSSKISILKHLKQIWLVDMLLTISLIKIGEIDIKHCFNMLENLFFGNKANKILIDLDGRIRNIEDGRFYSDDVKGSEIGCFSGFVT